MDVALAPDGTLSLRDADDFRSFRLVSRMPREALDLAAAEPGADLSAHATKADHVWIPARTVSRLAPGRDEAAWRQGFEAMIEKARGYGWVDGSGRICAHVVFEPHDSQD